MPHPPGGGYRGRVEPSVERPWWGRPALWIGLAAILVLLGVFVAPQFLGGVVLFVPFIWVRRGPR